MLFVTDVIFRVHATYHSCLMIYFWISKQIKRDIVRTKRHTENKYIKKRS